MLRRVRPTLPCHRWCRWTTDPYTSTTGARWHALCNRSPLWPTCHRRHERHAATMGRETHAVWRAAARRPLTATTGTADSSIVSRRGDRSLHASLVGGRRIVRLVLRGSMASAATIVSGCLVPLSAHAYDVYACWIGLSTPAEGCFKHNCHACKVRVYHYIN